MKKIIAFYFICLTTLFTQAQYQGRVFIDSNENGIYDTGEKLLKGVSVSDGLNVVTTSDQGEYYLEGHTKEKFIFITTPSGYKTNNDYYRRIRPKVSQYDFGIMPYEGGIQKNGSHQFIHISDTEIGEMEGHEDWVTNLRDYVTNEKTAFIIHTGDICYPAGLKNHIKLMNTSDMNTQVFYCIGNHDLVQGKYGEELFEELYGPVFYSFEAGNIHYIVTPMPNGDYAPSYTQEDVYHWIKNDLKQVDKQKPVVIFNHDLLDHTGVFKFGISKTDYIDLKEHNLKAWLYGHWHINHIIKHPESGVYSVCTSTLIRGGIDHASSGFRIMKMDPRGNFKSEMRYSYIDKSIQIASIGNQLAPVLSDGKVPLSVNTYSTISPTTQVSYTCIYEGKQFLKNNAMKQQTDFNWYAEIPMPQRLNGKFITVSVTAHFANGEITRNEKSFIYHSQAKETIVNSTASTNLLRSPDHWNTPNDTLRPPLSLVWVRNIKSNIYMTSPLIYNHSIYIASIDENNSEAANVICMDAQNGNIRWKHNVRGSIKNSIAITNETVFAQDIYGYLYAIDCQSGHLKWEKKLNVAMIPALNDGLIASEGIVYAGTGLGLSALKAQTGEELWINKAWQQGEGCTATLSLKNNVLIGHSHWRSLYANDATTGNLLWQLSANGLRHRSSAAAMTDHLLYLLSDAFLFIIESQTGNILVRKPLGYSVNVASIPVITDKEIIFGTATNGVVALDKETLIEKWNFKTKPALIFSAPYTRNPSATVETSAVVCGSTVFIAASDGYIYGLDKSTGKPIWHHATGAPFFASVAVSGNALYAADFSGNVYCFTETQN